MIRNPGAWPPGICDDLGAIERLARRHQVFVARSALGERRLDQVPVRIEAREVG